MWQHATGWREILTRILGEFAVEVNITPVWLRNPETRRLLKLDLYYPDVAIAVRFVGLQGTRKTRKSDEEELEEVQRNDTRAELCRVNGVRLISIDLVAGEPRDVFNEFSRALAFASRTVAQANGQAADKQRLMPGLAAARHKLEQIRSQVRSLDDVARYADAWRDRETAAIVEAQNGTSGTAAGSFRPGRIVTTVFKPGTEVRHERYGQGTVTAVAPDGNDLAITISFVTAGERRFLASLVQDKLTVV